MAKFRALKGYHFSPDGTEENTWAKFEKVPKSDPVVYEYDTDDKTSIALLRKLIEDETDGYTDITEVEEKPAKKAPAAKAPAKKAAAVAAKPAPATPAPDGAGNLDGNQAAGDQSDGSATGGAGDGGDANGD
jgi:hypothetical protein